MVTLASIPPNLRRAPLTWQRAAKNLLGREIVVFQVDKLGFSTGRELQGQAFKIDGLPIALVRVLGDPWIIAETFVHEILHHKYPTANFRAKPSGGWRVSYNRNKRARATEEATVDFYAQKIMGGVRNLYKKPPHDRPEWWYSAEPNTRGLVVLEEIIEIIAEATV